MKKAPKEIAKDLKDLNFAIQTLSAAIEAEKDIFYSLKVKYGFHPDLGNRQAVVNGLEQMLGRIYLEQSK